MVATTELDIDEARSRTILFNLKMHRSAGGAVQVFFIGLWYRHRLVRTPDGRRIAECYEEMGWTHIAPEMAPVPEIG